MRTAGLAALVCAAAAVAGAPVVALAATKRVVVGDNYFVREGPRPTVTVQRGDTVRWVWRAKNLHTVSVRSGPERFRSRAKARGSFQRRMSQRGTYVIFCEIHGFPTQTMNLVVR